MSDNIVTIEGHVLLPHQADWTRRPEMPRAWKSNVDASLDADEDRSSSRPAAWLKLTYYVRPYDHVEAARFADRMRAALKAAKVAVPKLGSSVPLSRAATAGHAQLWLLRPSHGFAVGQRLVVQSSVAAEYDTWDLCTVAEVDGARLGLAAGIANGYPERTRVWPLLYGRPEIKQFAISNTTRASYTVTVEFDQRVV